MICPKCSKAYDDSWKICLNDGAVLEFSETSNTVATETPGGSMRPSKRPLIFFISIFALLLFLYSYSKGSPQIPNRAVLGVSGGSARGSEGLLNERKDLKFAILPNNEAHDQELDQSLVNKLGLLLRAYGYEVVSLEDANYAITLRYHIKSSGSVWEATSGYKSNDWKEKGWFRHSIRGLHRYQLSLTMAVYDKRVLSVADPVWMIDINGMIRTDNFSKPLDFGLVGAMRLFGRGIINLYDNPRILEKDNDLQLLLNPSSDPSLSSASNLFNKASNERIVDGAQDDAWYKFDKFFKEAGIEMSEKSQKNGYFETSQVSSGLLSKLGIADDHVDTMFEELPEIRSGKYVQPSGYYMTVYLRGRGSSGTFVKTQIYAKAYTRSGKDGMPLISTHGVENQLMDRVL